MHDLDLEIKALLDDKSHEERRKKIQYYQAALVPLLKEDSAYERRLHSLARQLRDQPLSGKTQAVNAHDMAKLGLRMVSGRWEGEI